jgi:hypothetical protein
MPWLKKAGESPRNPKIWELSDAAYRLYDSGLCYAAENLTDGHLPNSRVSALKSKPATPAQIVELTSARLWHRLPDLTCKSCIASREKHRAAALPRTGFIIHDFLQYNPSRVEWEERERHRAGLAQVGGQARAAQAARSHGRFTSGTAGDPTSRETSGDTSGTAGEKGEIHQPSDQPAAGENDQRRPAVAPAPYSVLRTPSSDSYEGDRTTEEPEIPDDPRAADRSRDRATKTRELGPIARGVDRLLADARARTAS